MAVAMHMKHQESDLRGMASFCVLHDGIMRQKGPCKGLVKIVVCRGLCQRPFAAHQHQPHRHMRLNEACPCSKQGLHALVHAGARRNPYKKLAMVVAVMAFAGFTAGLLGIGGALIFNPVLLQLGVQPQVSSTSRSLHACRSVDAYICHKPLRLSTSEVEVHTQGNHACSDNEPGFPCVQPAHHRIAREASPCTALGVHLPPNVYPRHER